MNRDTRRGGKMLEQNQFFYFSKLSTSGLGKGRAKKRSDSLVESYVQKFKNEKKNYLHGLAEKKWERFRENMEKVNYREEARAEEILYDLEKKEVRFEKTRERLEEKREDLKRRLKQEEEMKKAKVIQNQ